MGPTSKWGKKRRGIGNEREGEGKRRGKRGRGKGKKGRGQTPNIWPKTAPGQFQSNDTNERA